MAPAVSVAQGSGLACAVLNLLSLVLLLSVYIVMVGTVHQIETLRIASLQGGFGGGMEGKAGVMANPAVTECECKRWAPTEQLSYQKRSSMAPSRGHKQFDKEIGEEANTSAVTSKQTQTSSANTGPGRNPAERPSPIVTALSGALSGSLISACVQVSVVTVSIRWPCLHLR